MFRAKLKAKGLLVRILEALPLQKLKILIGELSVWAGTMGGYGVCLFSLLFMTLVHF